MGSRSSASSAPGVQPESKRTCWPRNRCDAGRCPRPPAVYEEKTKTMNSTPIAGAMTKKAMNEVLRKAARSLGLATLAVERGDRQAVLTELATVEVEMARVRAALADARNADLPEFARFFGCPAEFGRAV